MSRSQRQFEYFFFLVLNAKWARNCVLIFAISKMYRDEHKDENVNNLNAEIRTLPSRFQWSLNSNIQTYSSVGSRCFRDFPSVDANSEQKQLNRYIFSYQQVKRQQTCYVRYTHIAYREHTLGRFHSYIRTHARTSTNTQTHTSIYTDGMESLFKTLESNKDRGK